MNKLELEGKEQIRIALKNIGMDIEDIDNDEYDEDEYLKEEEETRELPDDPMDLATDKFLNEFQQGGH